MPENYEGIAIKSSIIYYHLVVPKTKNIFRYKYKKDLTLYIYRKRKSTAH